MRWIPLRDDEAQAIHARIEQLRPDLVEHHWETRAAQLETVLALAAWRSMPLEDRVDALIDVLDVARDTSGPLYGRFAKEVDRS